MKTYKKLILSIAMMCLVVAVIVIGVLSVTSVTFTIYNRATFSATNANCGIVVTGTNAGNSISIANGSFNLSTSSGQNQDLNIPDQYFVGTGVENAIVYTVYITNQGTNNLRVSLVEATGNGSVSVTHNYSIDGQSSNSQERGVLYQNETYTITITYELLSAGSDVDYSSQLAFTIEETSDMRPSSGQPIGNDTITLTYHKEEYLVNNSFQTYDITVIRTADSTDVTNECIVSIDGETGLTFTTTGTKTVNVSYSGTDGDGQSVSGSLSYNVTVTSLPITHVYVENQENIISSYDENIDRNIIDKENYDGDIGVRVSFDDTQYSVYAIRTYFSAGELQSDIVQFENNVEETIALSTTNLSCHALTYTLYSYATGQEQDWITNNNPDDPSVNSGDFLQKYNVDIQLETHVTNITLTKIYYDEQNASYSTGQETMNVSGTNYPYSAGLAYDKYTQPLRVGDLGANQISLASADFVSDIAVSVEPGYTFALFLGENAYNSGDLLTSVNDFYVYIYNDDVLTEIMQIVLNINLIYGVNSDEGLSYTTAYTDNKLPGSRVALLYVNYDDISDVLNNVPTNGGADRISKSSGVICNYYDITNTNEVQLTLNEFHNVYIVRCTVPNSSTVILQAVDFYCDKYNFNENGSACTIGDSIYEIGSIALDDDYLESLNFAMFIENNMYITTYIAGYVFDNALVSSIRFPFMDPALTFSATIVSNTLIKVTIMEASTSQVIDEREYILTQGYVSDDNIHGYIARNVFGPAIEFEYDSENDKYVLGANSPMQYYDGEAIWFCPSNPYADVTASSNVTYYSYTEAYYINQPGLQTVTFVVTATDGIHQATYEMYVNRSVDLGELFTISAGTMSKTVTIDTWRWNMGDLDMTPDEEQERVDQLGTMLCLESEVSSAINTETGILTATITDTDDYTIDRYYHSESRQEIVNLTDIQFPIYDGDTNFPYIEFVVKLYQDAVWAKVRLYIVRNETPVTMLAMNVGEPSTEVSTSAYINCSTPISGYLFDCTNCTMTLGLFYGRVNADNVQITTVEDVRYISVNITSIAAGANVINDESTITSTGTYNFEVQNINGLDAIKLILSLDMGQIYYHVGVIVLLT